MGRHRAEFGQCRPTLASDNQFRSGPELRRRAQVRTGSARELVLTVRRTFFSSFGVNSRQRISPRLPNPRRHPDRGADRTEVFIVPCVEFVRFSVRRTLRTVPAGGCWYYGFVTLIISVLTDEYVALVSDRRVTWSDGRQVDTDTKTFNLYGQFLMGFTGLARIDGFRMERWVADALRSVPTDEYFNVLAQKMGTAFDRRRSSDRKPQALLATGYASLQPGGRVYPMNVIISNSIDNNGDFRPARCSGSSRFTWNRSATGGTWCARWAGRCPTRPGRSSSTRSGWSPKRSRQPRARRRSARLPRARPQRKAKGTSARPYCSRACRGAPSLRRAWLPGRWSTWISVGMPSRCTCPTES